MNDITKKCPMCAEQIPLAAVTCEYCGAQFEVTSSGYCQTCHDVRESDENGQCKVCGNAVADLRVESRLIEEPVQASLPVSQPIVQPEITKTGKRRVPFGALAFGLVLIVIGLFLLFGRNSIPAVFSPFATDTPAPTITFAPTVTSTSTPSPTATLTLTPTITPTTAPPYDDFEGGVLDSKKWVIVLDWGNTVFHHSSKVRQDERLMISVDNTKPDTSTYIQSTWGFTEDFDIQIDFQMSEGWGRPSTGHLDSAILGVTVNKNMFHITRLIASQNEDNLDNSFMAWTDRGASSFIKSTVATSGKYRLIRTGTSLGLLYDVGAGWVEVGTLPIPSGFAKVYFGIASINASHGFATYFDNFVINSGIPLYR